MGSKDNASLEEILETVRMEHVWNIRRKENLHGFEKKSKKVVAMSKKV